MKKTARRKAAAGRKVVNLALRGGGSHGAFTWGVLDALLEDGRIDFDGVTGASAGVMNAVVMADGWRRGVDAGGDPRAAARAALADFWHAIGAQPSVFALNPLWSSSMPQALAANPLLLWMDLVTRVFTPQQWNPFDYNPLRTVLEHRIDFARLRAQPPFRLFVAATNVRTGRVRIFRERELERDVLLASACLPFAFRAVEVQGEAYWDGGYMGNPALWPLFYATQTPDLLLVQINPLRRDELPDSAQEIVERTNEISFNASLLHEMRAIEFVQRLLAQKKIDPEHYRRVWLHMISAEECMRGYGASSKYNTSLPFLRELLALGRATAREWLDFKYEYVGHVGSVRIAEAFL